MIDSKKIYTVGISSYWGTLTPPLQHLAAGDVVISQQFESLIRRNERGIIEPLAAKTWEFNADRLTLRFKIDTSRRFSDGTYLRAGDFKKAWEEGLKMSPISSNSSLSDGLANVKGFSDFNKAKEIAGVRVIGEDVLELQLVKPVRMFLEYLAGQRFSVYKISEGNIIGTGPYILREKDQVLTLTPNPYFAEGVPPLKNVKIVVAPPPVASAKLISGEIDALLMAEMVDLPACQEESSEIVCSHGQEGRHILVNLNGLPNRFFSDPKHRMAFQALVLKSIPLAADAFSARSFTGDIQTFLKFQAGRIPDEEARAIVSEGEKYIGRFVEATKKQPLYFAANAKSWQWLYDLLVANGVRLTKNSSWEFVGQGFWDMYYKTYTPDIFPMSISISDGDPDGLYHILGKNGAVTSPMIQRTRVSESLESGRQIIDVSKLPAHYQTVSREILKEVPYVHLGYLYNRLAYNRTKLKVDEVLLGRNNSSVMALQPK
jgi:ABC-type transport system substrate-binding protein